MAKTATREPLKPYAAKRNFKLTREPKPVRARKPAVPSFVIQKHWASRLHYDFRLEWDGVLLSWAVPRGPSFDPKDKRMAVHVEDHPVDYASFEGTIPKGQYGGGTVIVWDRGTWEPVGDPKKGMTDGKLLFKLHGEKLAGLWELVRIAKPGEKQDQWILFKKKDEWATPKEDYDVISALPDSVVEQPLGLLEDRDPRAASARQAQRTEETQKLPASELPGAVKAPLPAKLGPQLATLAKGLPSSGDWSYEIKFDGYRILTRIEAGKARLITRGGHDWTSKMRPLQSAIESLGIDSGWLDGEVVVLNAQGVPDFNALQNAFDASKGDSMTYFVFDLPYLNGVDLRAAPLYARRALLKSVIAKHAPERVRMSEDFLADPKDLLESARAMGLEGIIAKRADSPYVSQRTETWLKFKGSERQELVVLGFTDRSGATGEVGSLLLGYWEAGVLQYAGDVGTGWDSKTARALHEKLAPLKTEKPPVLPETIKPGRWSKRGARREQWVKPQVVVEVAFGGWTPDKRVRHAVFKGVRRDKAAQSVTREVPRDGPDGARSNVVKAGNAANTVPLSKRVKVSNPERVIDATSGLTKLDLVRYYESVAPWMLPHLAGRPLSLVRAPSGVAGQQFFQKHDEKSSIPGLKALDPTIWPGHPGLLEIDTAEGLVSAAQMNVVEFHTWNSTSKKLNTPDRMIFDLDPGEGVKWKSIQEAALLTRSLLSELGLESWLKTSGGKGLHVVVPIAPRRDYDTVRDFSAAIVQHLAQTIPARFVAKSGASNRVGKIYVDYLRNNFGQTTAAAFSARARPGLGVSMPIGWEDLESLKSASQWTIATAREYLSFQKDDPWKAYWTSSQLLTAPMKRLGFTPKARKA